MLTAALAVTGSSALDYEKETLVLCTSLFFQEIWKFVQVNFSEKF